MDGFAKFDTIVVKIAEIKGKRGRLDDDSFEKEEIENSFSSGFSMGKGSSLEMEVLIETGMGGEYEEEEDAEGTLAVSASSIVSSIAFLFLLGFSLVAVPAICFFDSIGTIIVDSFELLLIGFKFFSFGCEFTMTFLFLLLLVVDFAVKTALVDVALFIALMFVC